MWKTDSHFRVFWSSFSPLSSLLYESHRPPFFGKYLITSCEMNVFKIEFLKSKCFRTCRQCTTQVGTCRTCRNWSCFHMLPQHKNIKHGQPAQAFRASNQAPQPLLHAEISRQSFPTRKLHVRLRSRKPKDIMWILVNQPWITPFVVFKMFMKGLIKWGICSRNAHLGERVRWTPCN